MLGLCSSWNREVVPGIAKAQNSCSYVDINTAKDLGEASTHCVTLPIYKNTPLIFVQYETYGKSYNRFEVKLMSSSASNAGVVDSFLSGSYVTVNRSSQASLMGQATLRISASDSGKNSSVKLVYGDVEGIATVFIHNVNTAETVPNPPPRPPGGGCYYVKGTRMCVDPLSAPLTEPTKQYYAMTASSDGIPACNVNNSSPRMPDNFDMNANLSKAEEFKARMNNLSSKINSYGDVFEAKNLGVLKSAIKYSWAVRLLNDGAPLDIKAQYGEPGEFESFGNFHYGAFLRAAGFERTEILSGASTNQEWKDSGGGWGAVWPAIKAWFTQEADHPPDTEQITKGMNYTDEVYSNDSGRIEVSDSCDPTNGLIKSGSDSGGSSGGGGGRPPGSGSGGSSGTIVTYGCELWKFPNGNGGYYYMNRNCRYFYMP